jgi:hypothetical protein
MVIKLTQQSKTLSCHLSLVASMLQADETTVWFGANQAALHIARVTLVFEQR